MEQKINKRMIWIAFLAILITSMSITMIYYRSYRRQVFQDLQLTCELLASEDTISAESLEQRGTRDVRITWIDAAGKVLYDNWESVSSMKNHADRSEFKEAQEYGFGKASRKSETIRKSMFYYAVRLPDHSVLRCAREISSVLAMYNSAVRSVVMIAALLVLVCVLFAHILTKNLLRPIELAATDIEGYVEKPIYKELLPFMNKIRSQHERILKAANMRQEFTANVSHELKTPLTAISGYAELIENQMVSQEQAIRFAGEIKENSSRLLSLIDDIIRLSELDNREIQLRMEDVDLFEHAKRCTKRLMINARQRGISLSCQGKETVIKADSQMIDELIENLAANAIRYNNPGGFVRIEVKQENGCAQLIVQDNGIGIPKEDQERIFERFYRVDKSRSKETGGTGLGLSIVKHILELHHVEIQVESEKGKGTLMRVLFPVSPEHMDKKSTIAAGG